MSLLDNSLFSHYVLKNIVSRRCSIHVCCKLLSVYECITVREQKTICGSHLSSSLPRVSWPEISHLCRENASLGVERSIDRWIFYSLILQLDWMGRLKSSFCRDTQLCHFERRLIYAVNSILYSFFILHIYTCTSSLVHEILSLSALFVAAKPICQHGHRGLAGWLAFLHIH